jgi:transposase
MGMYVGIDLALVGKHEACFERGGKTKTFRFSNLPAEIERFVEWAKSSGEAISGFVMEPTGAAWIPLARFLIASEYPVFLVKSDKVQDLRMFYRKHAKSDRIDALTLARIPEVNPDGVYPYRFPDARQESLKKRVRVRQRLVEAMSKRKLQVQATYDVLLPGWRDVLEGRTLLGKMGRRFAERFGDLRKVKRLGHERFRAVVAESTTGRGLLNIPALHSLCISAHDFHEKSRTKADLDLFYADMVCDLDSQLRLFEEEEKQLASLDEEIADLYHALDPDGLLESLTGIGPNLAPMILAFAGDINRFPNVKKFRSFCGLCPRKRQSGMHDIQGLSMTKAGPSLLKMAFYLAAETARRFDPEMAAFYHRLRERGKHHNKILCAVAAKMATRVYAVLKRRIDGETRKYELRDFQGRAVGRKEAVELIRTRYGKNLKEAKKKTSEERLKIEAALKSSSRCTTASACTMALTRS